METAKEWVCINLRSDYEYATIEYLPLIDRYVLHVKRKKTHHSSNDYYKTLQGAKSNFSKEYQTPRWGNDYPKPIWEQVK